MVWQRQWVQQWLKQAVGFEVTQWLYDMEVLPASGPCCACSVLLSWTGARSVV